MQRLKLMFVILVVVLTMSPVANAQVPELVPVPATLDAQQREDLGKRKSQLEAQWYNLVLKVNDHNRKCTKVPANTPLANECRENMKSLQGQIAAHIEAVNGFNQAVQRQTTIDRIEVPPPRVPLQEACAEEAGCLFDAGLEKAMSWLGGKIWDARVWANDPMHRQWLGDAWDIFMTGAGLPGSGGEVGRIRQLTRTQYEALRQVSKKYGIKFGISGGHAETDIGLLRRADPLLQDFLHKWRRGPVSKLGDVDLWFEGVGGWRDLRSDAVKRQVAKEVGEILGRNKGKAIDFKYGKYYSTENELLERAGGLIFDRGAAREGLAHWQVPGLWRPTPEMESTFLTVWQN